jgi:glutaredoxin
VADPLLEYVTSSGCADCREFEALVASVRPDFPTVEVRAVAAQSARGTELSLGRGIMRFPVIVLDDEILATESIPEADLRTALARRTGASV